MRLVLTKFPWARTPRLERAHGRRERLAAAAARAGALGRPEDLVLAAPEVPAGRGPRFGPEAAGVHRGPRLSPCVPAGTLPWRCWDPPGTPQASKSVSSRKFNSLTSNPSKFMKIWK